MTTLKTRLFYGLRLHKALGYQSMDQIDRGDYYIVGYPKSGNTWMQYLLTGLAYDMSMKEANNRLVRELTPDVHMFPWFKRFIQPMFFKSHHLPRPEYQNVIYIARDGRDALTSYYHMLIGQGRKIEMEQMIKNGTGLFPGKWHQHIRQWLDNPFQARIHFVRYEDLKTDPMTEMKKLCDFTGISRSDEQLQTIIDNCSFSSLRQKETSILWDKNKKWKKDKFFVRKGETGDYQNSMTPEQIEFFNREAEAELKHFGYNL